MEVTHGTTRHARDEVGALGGIEGLAFGLLIFTFGTLMVINAWAIVDGKLSAAAAAREAGRTYVEAPDRDRALARAKSAARRVADEQQSAVPHLTVVSAGGQKYRRCDRITTTVRIDVPRISLPLIGGTGGTYPVTASHTEIIDPYRSGLPATTFCS